MRPGAVDLQRGEICGSTNEIRGRFDITSVPHIKHQKTLLLFENSHVLQ